MSSATSSNTLARPNALLEKRVSILARLAERFPDCEQIAARWLRRRPAPSLSPLDLAHEACMKLAREEQRRRRAQRSELAAKPTQMLDRIYHRVCRDVLFERWIRREIRREQPLGNLDVGAHATRDSTLVNDALRQLAARSRASAQAAELVRLRQQGLSLEECASRVGVSKRTAVRRIRHALDWLRPRFCA